METVDCVVIGAGVVGLSVARSLARMGRDVIVLEAENAPGTITSSRNSGVIHAGLYYQTNSLKARLCVEGNAMLYDFAKKHGVPHKRCGKIVVATDDRQLAKLHAVYEQSKINNVPGVRLLTAAEAKTLEPELHCVAALEATTSGLIDQHGLMHEIEGDAENHGAMIALNSPVLGGTKTADGLVLRVGGSAPMELLARNVVNAAGLAAQRVAANIEGIKKETIPPQVLAKGNYFTLIGRKPPFERLIYPLPVPGGLGAHFTNDLGGQGLLGPGVEWVETKPHNELDYNVDPSRAASFYESVRRFWPGLQDGQLQPGYSGVRPKLSKTGSAESDFVIQEKDVHGVPGLINLYGIDSPGLTASLALGEKVAGHLTTPA